MGYTPGEYVSAVTLISKNLESFYRAITTLNINVQVIIYLLKKVFPRKEFTEDISGPQYYSLVVSATGSSTNFAEASEFSSTCVSTYKFGSLTKRRYITFPKWL